MRLHLVAAVQLLDEQLPVVEVVVDPEVARLVDVGQQPGALVHPANPVALWEGAGSSNSAGRTGRTKLHQVSLRKRSSTD